jgi:hypothetical protein
MSSFLAPWPERSGTSYAYAAAFGNRGRANQTRGGPRSCATKHADSVMHFMHCMHAVGPGRSSMCECSKRAEHHPSRERTSGSAGRVSSGWRATNEGTGTTKAPSTKSAKRDGESAITNPTNGMNVGSRNCGHWFDRFADPFLRVMRGFRGMAKLAVTRRIERAGQTGQIAYRCSL